MGAPRRRGNLEAMWPLIVSNITNVATVLYLLLYNTAWLLLGCTGGHYVTYALNDVSRLWYEFNDAIVAPVNKQTVQSCQAYVLFYRYCSVCF